MIMSVRFSVRRNSPLHTGPRCATVSSQKKPGIAQASSPAVRTVIEFLSKGPAVVQENPQHVLYVRGRELPTNCCRTHLESLLSFPRAVTKSPRTHSPWNFNESTFNRIDTTKNFPRIPPDQAYTF